MIKSPYNFVPAPSENEVFIPDWADQVSHDIPFSDGESGEIEFTITAETPIFIRNGHAQGKDTSEFCNVDGKYFIPATSIKGMLRNVLEIMSRGRMIQVDNNHHAIRQIMRPNSVLADEGYELSGNEKKKINAGWLVKKGQDYYLFDCGKPYKIRYTDIDKKMKTNFGDHFGEKKLTDLSNFDNKTGSYKYLNLLNGKSLEHSFEIHPLDEDDKQKSWVSRFQHLDYVRFHDQNDSDLPSFEGTLVCTGQATDYISNRTARKGEYVFAGNKKELLKNSLKAVKLTKNAVDAFKFINRNIQPDELKDWTYWKNKQEIGIPVFYRWDEENISIKDMGLTFMYKTPTKNDIHDLLPYEFEKGKLIAKSLDLAETIFGCVRNEKLKGRVFISNAQLSGNTTVKFLPEVRVALSNPKSSFYPNYLIQEGKNGKTSKFNTYNTGSSLRGYKRYPVKRKLVDNQGTGDMSTTFKPLDEGSQFNCKIRFHNLREVEIGALLSSLSFHKSDPIIFHSIGMGKPLGYGAIKLEINRINFLKHPENDYLKAFEKEMKMHDKNWGNDVFIQELIQMASFQTEEIENHLVYPKLENFQEYKNSGNYLPKYSEITKIGKGIINLLSDTELQNTIDVKNADKMAAEKLRAEWEEILKNSNVNQSESSLEKLLSDCPFDDLKNDLINVLKIVRETNLLENDKKSAIESNTQEGYELFLNKHKDSIFDIEIRSKIKALKASELAQTDLVFNKYDFEDIKKEVNKLMKNKHFQFSEMQKLQIYEALKLSWDIENKKVKKSAFLKKDKLAKISDYPWTDISKWLGLEAAQSLYDELTKP